MKVHAALLMLCCVLASAFPAEGAPPNYAVQAETQASRIAEADEKNKSLIGVLAAHALNGDVKRARSIAVELPRKRRWIGQAVLAKCLAEIRLFDEAEEVARSIDNNVVRARVLVMVVRRRAKVDISGAKKLAGTIDPPYCSQAFLHVVREEVVQDRPLDAMRTAGSVTANDEKPKASAWLIVGNMLGTKLDLKEAARIGHMKVEQVSSLLADVAEEKAQRGETTAAADIARQLPSSMDQVRVYLAIANRQVADQAKDKARRVLKTILAELDALKPDDSDSLHNLMLATRLAETAHLQVELGDWDGGVETAEKALRASKKDAMAEGVFNSLGGRQMLITLALQAGKIDEAVRLATDENGKLLPEAIVMLIQAHAADGNDKAVEKLIGRLDGPAAKCAGYLAAAEGARSAQAKKTE